MGDLVIDCIDTFRNKRVLITGDTGFKGSWLAYWLYLLGAKVYGFALPPEHDYDHYAILKLEKFIQHIDGDIRDYFQIYSVLKKIEPEIVFHLAAQAIVRKSYTAPRMTFETNILGSINLLEAIRSTSSVKVLIFVTSDKCYKNKEWCWGYREIDELGGKDPYSASKAAAELVFSAYQNSFFFDRKDFGAASTRAGNVIGGGDWSEDRLVPDCIRALKSNQPIQLRNPSATRPWQHVMEPLSGYLILAEKIYDDPYKYRGSYNFGPAYGNWSVKELAEEIVAAWGSGTIEEIQATKYPESGILHLNCDRAHHCLGWYPKWDFRKAVQQTTTWYKMVDNTKSARNVTKQHISEYLECCL